VCRVANFEFDAVATSVPKARGFVAECLDRWDVADLKESALLLTSELVSNSVKHTSGGGVVSVAMAGDVLEIGVTDLDLKSLPAVTVNPISTNGSLEQGVDNGRRGLMIVDHIADHWGVEELAQGKHVWFRLNKDDWAFRSACRCDEKDVDRIRIGSGEFVSVIAGPWDL